MLFTEDHVKKILNGEKTQTRRIWKRPHAKVDGIYKVKTKMMSKEYYGKIQVSDIRQEPLGKMTDYDAWDEGCYNLEEFKKIWAEINKDKGGWNPCQIVTVIYFVLVSEGPGVITW